jgi:hypothetical protein
MPPVPKPPKMFTVAAHETHRYERIRELLDRFDMYTDARASVMLDMTDLDTPSDFSALARRGGFQLADAMRTEQLMKRLSTRLGRPGEKVDREQRDYAIAPLRELGVVQKTYVLPQKDWPKTGDALIIVGKHFSKSGNNSYRVTDEVRALLQASKEEWGTRLDAFVVADPRRRVRLLQKQAIDTLGTTVGQDRHKALIRATVDALRMTRCQDFAVVFIDDEDDQRVREEWRPQLEELNLMPDEEEGRYPDAILARESSREVWFVDAVTSDGEIDEVRRADLVEWLAERGWTAAGFTTSYETWTDAAKRQSKHKNLAIGTTLWIAEDGGKLLAVTSLAG